MDFNFLPRVIEPLRNIRVRHQLNKIEMQATALENASSIVRNHPNEEVNQATTLENALQLARQHKLSPLTRTLKRVVRIARNRGVENMLMEDTAPCVRNLDIPRVRAPLSIRLNQDRLLQGDERVTLEGSFTPAEGTTNTFSDTFEQLTATQDAVEIFGGLHNVINDKFDALDVGIKLNHRDGSLHPSLVVNIRTELSPPGYGRGLREGEGYHGGLRVFAPKKFNTVRPNLSVETGKTAGISYSQVKLQALSPKSTIGSLSLDGGLGVGMSSESSLTDFAKEKQFFIEPVLSIDSPTFRGTVAAPIRSATWKSRAICNTEQESQLFRGVSASSTKPESFASVDSGLLLFVLPLAAVLQFALQRVLVKRRKRNDASRNS